KRLLESRLDERTQPFVRIADPGDRCDEREGRVERTTIRRRQHDARFGRDERGRDIVRVTVEAGCFTASSEDGFEEGSEIRVEAIVPRDELVELPGARSVLILEACRAPRNWRSQNRAH